MAKLANIARMTTATTGTGTISLGSAVASFLTFAQAGINDGDTITYAIEDGANREIGRGVYTTAGLTLTRSVLKSTNSNSAISLSGAAVVLITAAAEDFHPLVPSPPPAAAGWIQKNFGGSTLLVDVGDGRVRITDPGPGGNTHEVRAAVRAVAGSNWTVIMKLRSHGRVATQYGNVGIVAFDNASGNYAVLGNSGYASGQSVYVFSNATTFSGNTNFNDPTYWFDMWFKIKWDGTTFSIWTSVDGTYWALWTTNTDAKFWGMTNNATHIGFGFDVNNNNNHNLECALDLISWTESSP